MRVTICGVDAEEIVEDQQCIDYVEYRDAELLVTVGEDALIDCAARADSRPIVPVGLETPLSPSRRQVTEILHQLSAQPPTVDVRPLSVTTGGTVSKAVFDTTLVTTEPARISEYAVSVDGRAHATFRADGVVVATPLGSSGYGRAAGGPVLAPETGLAVVPVAPFATIADTWVVEPPLSVRVKRDDSVTVLADANQLAVGHAGLTAEIEWGEPLSIVDIRRLDLP